MNKKALLACLLAVMMLLSGCSLVVKDTAVDAASEIVRVGDTVYTKGQVQQMVDSYLVSMQNYYTQNYGYAIDITSANVISSAQDDVINNLIQQAVVEAKEKELGVAELSAEKQAEVDDTWNQYIDLIKQVFLADSELEGEELEETAAMYVYNYLGTTKAGMEASAKEAALKEKIVADMAVTDEEIKADFDAKVEAAKTTYESNLSAYGASVNNGESVYYRPAGYRMVKSILLKFKQEDSDLIAALTTKATEQGTTINTKRNAFTAAEGAAELNLEELAALVNVEVAPSTLTAEAAIEPVVTDTLPADLAADLAQLVREYQTAVKVRDAAVAAKAEAIEAAYANLDAEADDILAQLDAGADWNALQAEKTQDPGMQSGVTAERGYAVCEGFTSFDSDYVAAAMQLANVGDHTGKVRSDSYGYFIIRYDAEVAEGATELADVSESIKNELLTSKQDALYTETVEKWVSEAGAKIDKKALND